MSFTCLIIDDDPDDHELFKEHVPSVSSGINCISAFNGKEALDRLRSGEYRPDVIFLDLNMPLVDGNQFHSTLRETEELKNIPVIILSTSTNQQHKIDAINLGALEFMSKPYKLADWKAELKRVFETHFPGVSE